MKGQVECVGTMFGYINCKQCHVKKDCEIYKRKPKIHGGRVTELDPELQKILQPPEKEDP